MTKPEIIDRREVRMLSGRQHTKRHILVGRAFDLPRREHSNCVPVHEQRQHHPRSKRPLASGVLRLQRPLD
jgi:hypothetical protein